MSGTAAAGRTPIPDLVVRPMRVRDLPRVLDIERRVYPRPWTLQLFESELSHADDRRYLVAVGRDSRRPRWWPRQLYGYAGVLVQAGEAHVTTVAVEPAEHRRKVATHLMLVLMQSARDMGAESATLEARVANRGAQRLYAGFGFAPVGVRPGYYAETGEDALIMWVHDLQAPTYGDRLTAQRDRLGAPGGASGAPDLHVPWVRDRRGLDGGPHMVGTFDPLARAAAPGGSAAQADGAAANGDGR